MRNYSIAEQKQIKVQNALIKDIIKDLNFLTKRNDLDKDTIKECIKIININFKI